MITDETVERVREAADIAQIIGEHVKLKKVGNSWRGPCPFHQGTHQNFSVVPSKGLYICFVCGEKGDVFTFLQKRMGIDFPTAVKQVADRVGIIVEEVQRRREGADTRQPYWDANAAVADYFRTQLWDEKEGEEARNYLSLRRVHRDVADRFGLGYAPRDSAAMRGHLNKIGMSDELLLDAGLLVRREENGELRPRFRSRLMFPIQDAASNYVGFGGRLLGPGEPKYLNSSESPVYSKSKLLYGLHMAKHAIRKDDHVLVVEGYFDVVRLVSAGFDWVVAPLGTALTDEQAALLRRYTKNAFLLYDSDRAGLKATFRSGDQLLRQGMSVQVVTLPDGEDPDSFVDKQGGNALEEQLKHAINVFERKVQLLQRAGSFTDLTRKRRALDRLLPSIRAASDPLTRDIYLARASEVAGVAKDILAHEADQLPAASFTRGAPSPRGESPSAPPRSSVRARPASRTSRTMPAAERGLIWLLLQDRSQVEPAGEQVGPEDFTDPALREIMQALLAADPSKLSGELAAELPEESAPVAQELLGEPLEDGFDAGAHLAACVAALRAAVIQRRLGDIDGEIPIATSEEKDALFVEKQRLHLEERALGVRRYKSFVR
jgi:DNA primase